MEPTEYRLEEIEAIVSVQIHAAKSLESANPRYSQLVANPDDYLPKTIAHSIVKVVKAKLSEPLFKDTLVSLIRRLLDMDCIEHVLTCSMIGSSGELAGWLWACE